MHESEGSHSESPNSPSNSSHRSHQSERSERPRKERRHEEEKPRREMRVRRYDEDPRRAPLAALKCKIPPLVRGEGVESYFTKSCSVLTDDCMKVRMVSYEFSGYALRMYHWSKSIEEYFKEIEVTLMKANVLESNETIIA
ncbi:hypothetical protein CR513_38437, partial [Mucuna pruriens]